MIRAWRNEVVPVWLAQVGEAYVEDGVVGAWGDRTKAREVAQKHLLNTSDTRI